MAIETKSQQVGEYLRKAILNGRWNVGERMPGEREMMSELRISRTTLRDAFNTLANDGLVTRKPGSGTYVARLPKTGVVALVAKAEGLTSSIGHWYGELVNQARIRIEEAGYRAVLSVGLGETVDELLSSMHLLDKPMAKELVGVLGLMNMGSLENILAEEGISRVSMEGFVPDGKHCVLLNHRRFVELAAEMFRAYGHDEFAFMCFDYPHNPYDMDDRVDEETFRLKRSAFRPDDERLVEVLRSSDPENACEAFKEWWFRANRPNAVLFDDEILCDGACRAILELGIKVPAELAIVTLASAGSYFNFPVPLTGIEYDPARVADAGWNMLQKLINGQHVDEPIVYISPSMRKGKSLGEA